MNKLEWYYILENYFTHNGEAAVLFLVTTISIRYTI